jgi:sugar phosphate isomerase/epimerase
MVDRAGGFAVQTAPAGGLRAVSVPLAGGLRGTQATGYLLKRIIGRMKNNLGSDASEEIAMALDAPLTDTAARKARVADRLANFNTALSVIEVNGKFTSSSLQFFNEPYDYVTALIDQAKDRGFQAVEIYFDDIFGPLTDPQSLSRFEGLKARVAELQAYARDAGIEMVVHQWAFTHMDAAGHAYNPDPARDEELFDEFLEFAAQAGAQRVTVHFADPTQVEGYAALVEKAAAKGIAVGLENAFYNTGRDYTDAFKYYKESKVLAPQEFVDVLLSIRDRLSPEALPYLGVVLDTPRALRSADKTAETN